MIKTDVASASRESFLTCSQIAEQHGFSSLCTFSGSFKAEFGLSPSAYRQRLRVRARSQP